MTTHVFIVNEQSFKIHLEYLFVGTGSKNNDVDFNAKCTSQLHPQSENVLVSMMADFNRTRVGDYVVFYVQNSNKSEGKFYGIFQIDSEPFLEPKSNNQYLLNELGKNLTFRSLIKPYQVYSEGVSEWEALDEIKAISSPNQMLWSLIYRKLKGNRGNTMITLYEAERLFNLIKVKNNHSVINSNSYTYENRKLVSYNNSSKRYSGNTNLKFDILPRLCHKKQCGKAYESHLQMFITQNIGKHTSLDKALNVESEKLEWLGNEVSCGVGMQRIDIMFSQKTSDIDREVVPIELKAVPASEDNIRQISRYIDWIEQYYVPNKPSTIRPVLICPESQLNTRTMDAFKKFNADSNGRYLPLEYIEFRDNNGNLEFTKTLY